MYFIHLSSFSKAKVFSKHHKKPSGVQFLPPELFVDANLQASSARCWKMMLQMLLKHPI